VYIKESPDRYHTLGLGFPVARCGVHSENPKREPPDSRRHSEGGCLAAVSCNWTSWSAEVKSANEEFVGKPGPTSFVFQAISRSPRLPGFEERAWAGRGGALVTRQVSASRVGIQETTALHENDRPGNRRNPAAGMRSPTGALRAPRGGGCSIRLFTLASHAKTDLQGSDSPGDSTGDVGRAVGP
jgi:hypothetical protein